MASAADDHLDFNTTLLTELVELGAVEAAEPIERAFAANLLDVGMMGDWEKVRRKLGVEGLALKMPENPHNSFERLRIRMGMGIFSNRPIFRFGDIDHDAEQAYYERAYQTFSKSSEAQQFIEQHGDLAWSQMLLQFGINHLGESVDEMTLSSVQEFVLDHVPRKVSTEATAAGAILGELARFWEYLNRVYKLPAAQSIVEWLKTDGLVARLKADLSNPANFGMAKSFFMQGKDAGYDMTSQAGLAEFMTAYNRSLAATRSGARERSLPSNQASALPVVGKRRVGRNDPCPCGSGKKYKKCSARNG